MPDQSLPEEIAVWQLKCLELWDVLPVNEAATKAVKLDGVWPEDCDVVTCKDLPAIIDQAKREERERLEKFIIALPDPEKLRLMAEWFDAQHDNGRWGDGREVQADLRKWADSVGELAAALDSEVDRDRD